MIAKLKNKASILEVTNNKETFTFKFEKNFFEDFLKTKYSENYMGTDDDMPDKFEIWLERLDTQEIINYAEEAISKLSATALGSRTSNKKAQASRRNGLKGGRPKTK
jgi:hypothetical protein